MINTKRKESSIQSQVDEDSSNKSESKQKFTSNLCAILNDPRKDRAKVNYLFTKTWGYDFIDTSPIPSILTVHSNYRNFKKDDFNEYLSHTKDRSLKHSKHRSALINEASSIDNHQYGQKAQSNQPHFDLAQIPQIFFDSNFSLTNTETFSAIIRLFNANKNDMKIIISKQDAESYKVILEKLSFYLDITESHITKQISTKANSFFTAIQSQDEVQEHVVKTCTAVKSLRKNIKNLDENVLLKSIKIIKLINLKLKMKSLIEKLELMSSVYHTQPTIQLHLASSEFTGALDLISMSQDILRQDLRGLRSMRNFDSQFVEIEKAIDKILHQEFVRYVMSDLSRNFSHGKEVSNQEKLCSLMLGILRVKATNFVDLFKDEIFIYLKSAIKQTIADYISQKDDDSFLNNSDDENNTGLIDKVRQLKTDEFLHLLTKVLTNIKIMLERVQSIVRVILNVIHSAAGVKSNDKETIEDFISTRELISKNVHSKLVSSLNALMINSTSYGQERIAKLLEGKFKENSLDKLSSNDFISISNLIDQFVLDFDEIANKKTSELRLWIQSQANKFISKFHNEKKEKLKLALESDRWKQVDVTSDIQNLVDNIMDNGFGTVSIKKVNSKMNSNSDNADYILIKEEKFLVFSSTVVLIKFLNEYCQFAIDIPNLTFDVISRLLELFKMFNSRLFQLILGAGATVSGNLKKITLKTLAITYRCLEFISVFIPIAKEFFLEKLEDKKANVEKQFDQIAKDFNQHTDEIYNKFMVMVDEIFDNLLSNYQVIAPVPSECFRSACSQIARIHQVVKEALSTQIVVKLFTEIHLKFKQKLAKRLKELNVTNDAGPKHGLVFSDMTYYIKQFKDLEGLHLISLNFDDVWVI